MKKPAFILAGLLSLAMAGPVRGQQLFADDFESGNLNQWTGKLGLPHHGQLVSDPLSPTNHVLTFTQVATGGDIFNVSVIALSARSQPIILSFDFLGLSTEPMPPMEFGGFAGITTDPDGRSPHYWLAGTFPPALNVPSPVATTLTADGKWHHYVIDFTSVVLSNELTAIQVMLEDWSDRLGVPGDVYFDNVRLVAGGALAIEQLVPCAGPITGGRWKRHGEYVFATVQAVKVYLERGLLTAEEGEEIVVGAARSDCGKR